MTQILRAMVFISFYWFLLVFLVFLVFLNEKIKTNGFLNPVRDGGDDIFVFQQMLQRNLGCSGFTQKKMRDFKRDLSSCEDKVKIYL